MKKQLVLSALLLTFLQFSFAQSQFWKKTDAEKQKNTKAQDQAPTEFAAFQLETAALLVYLKNAPEEFSVKAEQRDFTLQLPTPDGKLETFSICHSPIMAPELMAKFPDIRTYAGISLEKTGKVVRFTLSPRGMQGAVFKKDLGIDYIEPIEVNGNQWYQIYDRVHAPKLQKSDLSCLTIEEEIKQQLPINGAFTPSDAVQARELGEPVKLNTYRFACAATGEYTQDNGGTVASGLAAIVNHTNVLNGILERDVQARMILVANNEKLIFTDPVTDPYSGTDVGEWMAQNPDIVNQRLGMSSYDLGHVLARYQGGSAIGIAGGSLCSPGKARGCSAGFAPYGDSFMGTFSHEVGHQFGAGHTWNRCSGGTGRAGSSAFEPGSGNTIMSYYGSCSSDNVGGGDQLNYHGGTVQEMLFTQTTGSATGCAVPISTPNKHPDVSLPYQDGFFIPISTPFELQGMASDPDGHGLTYSWEEIDLGTELPLGTAEGNAPLFRCYAPNANTNRYFPRLPTVIANQTDKTELYADYSRDLTFRFIVRDNQLSGGGVTYKDVAFEATDMAGPFRVQMPNTSSASWLVGSLAEVQWDVANTDAAPVNCSHVNIRLSLDGGQTYPTILAANVANDGSHFVEVPNSLSQNARVRIDAVGNVFYDISNQNFSIKAASTPSLSMGFTNDNAHICLPETLHTNLLTAGVGGYDSLISVSVLSGLPMGAVATFDKNTLMPGETAALSLDMSNSTQEGVYLVQVEAKSGTQTFVRTIKLTLTSNNFSAMVLLSPSDGATAVTQSPALIWNAVPDADFYEIQLASSPAFASGDILATFSGLTTPSYNTPVLLQKAKDFYWRVRGSNECGRSPWTATSAFATVSDICTDFQANDLPINILSGTIGSISSNINVFTPGTIQDINIKRLAGNHNYFQDIRISLKSPSGKERNLYDHNCGGLSVGFDFALDDQAPTPFTCPPPTNGAPRRPVQPLSDFNGEAMQGVWTLSVLDTVFGDGGRLDAFEIELCGESTQKSPILVVNDGLNLPAGTNKLIAAAQLKAEDADNGPDELRFTLVSVPHLGRLESYNSELFVGGQFTQTDINNGALHYFSYGSADQDDFRFTVIDGKGGFVGTETFYINKTVVDATEPLFAENWTLFPNPAQQSVFLRFDAPLKSTVRLQVFNTIGQNLVTRTLAQGSTLESLDLSAMVPGLYFVQLRSGAWMETRRLVVR